MNPSCLLLLLLTAAERAPPPSHRQTLASDRRSVVDGIGFFADRRAESIAYRSAAHAASAHAATPADADYASALDFGLARAALSAGRSDLDAAGDHLAHAADLDRAYFGASHPEYATTLNLLATVCRWGWVRG